MQQLLACICFSRWSRYWKKLFPAAANQIAGIQLKMHAQIKNKYIFWEIDNFVIKSDISRGFFTDYKNIDHEIIVYYENYFIHFMFGFHCHLSFGIEYRIFNLEASVYKM